MKYCTFFGIFLCLLLPQASFAMTETTFGGSIGATIKPANPGPFEQVTVALTSYDTDLRRATISWYLGGTKKTSGIGVSSYSFQAGEVGRVMSVRAVIETIEGGYIEKTLQWVPGNAIVLWSADTYTPSLYRGKALASPDSTIKLVAFPSLYSNSGTKYDPAKLVYTWTMDDKKDSIQTGTGNSSATYTLSTLPGDTEFTVDIASVDNTAHVQKKVTISTYSPLVALYEERSLEGTHYASRLTDTFSMKGVENTVRAEPFFIVNPISNAIFAWALNNQAYATGAATRALRTGTTQSGTAQLNVLVSKPDSSVQQAKASFTVQFSR